MIILILSTLWAIGAITYNCMFFSKKNRKYSGLEYHDTAVWTIVGISITIATPFMFAFDAYWVLRDLMDKR